MQPLDLLLSACTAPAPGAPAATAAGTTAATANGSGAWGQFLHSLSHIVVFRPPPAASPAAGPPIPQGSVLPLPAPGGRRWGPAAVWRGGLTADQCPDGRSDAACLADAMRAGGATPQAMNFAGALGFRGVSVRLPRFRPRGPRHRRLPVPGE